MLCIFSSTATATTEIYTLSLHDALPISEVPGRAHHPLPARRRGGLHRRPVVPRPQRGQPERDRDRSEEHTSELQSRLHLVCRLLLEKKKKKLETSLPPFTFNVHVYRIAL